MTRALPGLPKTALSASAASCPQLWSAQGTCPSAELAEPAGFDALTSHEREILIEVAAGLSNAEIAAKLFLAEATVKTHVGTMLNKLRLGDRVQAVVYAYEHGLVRPGSHP